MVVKTTRKDKISKDVEDNDINRAKAESLANLLNGAISEDNPIDMLNPKSRPATPLCDELYRDDGHFLRQLEALKRDRARGLDKFRFTPDGVPGATREQRIQMVAERKAIVDWTGPIAPMLSDGTAEDTFTASKVVVRRWHYEVGSRFIQHRISRRGEDLRLMQTNSGNMYVLVYVDNLNYPARWLKAADYLMAKANALDLRAHANLIEGAAELGLKLGMFDLCLHENYDEDSRAVSVDIGRYDGSRNGPSVYFGTRDDTKSMPVEHRAKASQLARDYFKLSTAARRRMEQSHGLRSVADDIMNAIATSTGKRPGVLVTGDITGEMSGGAWVYGKSGWTDVEVMNISGRMGVIDTGKVQPAEATEDKAGPSAIKHSAAVKLWMERKKQYDQFVDGMSGLKEAAENAARTSNEAWEQFAGPEEDLGA